MQTPQSSPSKKFKAAHASTGCRGPLLVDFPERGATITARRYVDTLQKLRGALKSNVLKYFRTESSFCMITRVPILPIWWGISFRYLAGKHFNILSTVQIFPLVTSTFLAIWRETFVVVGFIWTRKCKSGWGCGSTIYLPLSTILQYWSSRLPMG